MTPKGPQKTQKNENLTFCLRVEQKSNLIIRDFSELSVSKASKTQKFSQSLNKKNL